MRSTVQREAQINLGLSGLYIGKLHEETNHSNVLRQCLAIEPLLDIATLFQ